MSSKRMGGIGKEKSALDCYNNASSLNLLDQYVGMCHLVARTLERMLMSSGRIVRTLLQKCRAEDEIWCGNMVLI